MRFKLRRTLIQSNISVQGISDEDARRVAIKLSSSPIYGRLSGRGFCLGDGILEILRRWKIRQK